MTDEQIDFLYKVLSLTKMKVFLRDDGVFIPVTAISMNFVDKDSEFAEPVAWLGGLPGSGRCAALSCVEPSDFQIMSSGECF
jgi:hypothetical protein